MDNMLFGLKNVELLILEVFVIGAFLAVLAGGLYEIVKGKVQESRRHDQIAPEPTPLPLHAD